MSLQSNCLIAIYDFEFFPYALGDALTWSVRSAIRCEQFGKSYVDIYICMDNEHPVSIFQGGEVNKNNYQLFFNELYSVFGMNPKLGNIHVFRQRELMLSHLQEIAIKDSINQDMFNDYLEILERKTSKSYFAKLIGVIEQRVRASPITKSILKSITPTVVQEKMSDILIRETNIINYFMKNIYSHNEINAFYEKNGHIPFLQPAPGCTPDVDEIITQRLLGKKIVPFHLRLRHLDMGYGAKHTYERDSDFLEWYSFLKEASVKHPDVQFIALGRLQEKPLEILRLPNVTSVRLYGMGLGHELTLMLRSNLFIGTSSGFAALANFSAIPYFITKMNAGACKAYEIEYGAEKLPFANDSQKLIYEEETSELLMSLLEQGLKLSEANAPENIAAVSKPIKPFEQIDLPEWLKIHSQPSNAARGTTRFFIDDNYRNQETAFLLLSSLEKARLAFIQHDIHKTKSILKQMKDYFFEICDKFPLYLLLQGSVAADEKELALLQTCIESLDGLVLDALHAKMLMSLKNYLNDNHLGKKDREKASHVVKIKSQFGELNFMEMAN